MRELSMLRCMLLSLLVVATACGQEASGTAPEISELTYAPATVAVGAATTVQGTLRFSDPDGDLLELRVEVGSPSGERSELPPAMVSNAVGLTSGVVTLQLVLVAPSAGEYPLEVWLVDAEGNESNVLAGLVTAE